MTVQHINSESWCRKAYLNYHCYDNTMGLSPADMGEITQTWSHRLTSWQNSVSSDETEYDFDDTSTGLTGKSVVSVGAVSIGGKDYNKVHNLNPR